mmetsp:Transcript_25815/g.37890  ORF Transcript_25815/g.37890 Transcript_25815/m.37890 type:complete len:90 (-) Transcript_25815:214-483(-)
MSGVVTQKKERKDVFYPWLRMLSTGILSPTRICFSSYLLFEQLELPAKLLDYFSWSNKSNINQFYWHSISHTPTSPTPYPKCLHGSLGL